MDQNRRESAVRRGLPFQLVHALLGLVLVAAGVSKLAQLAEDDLGGGIVPVLLLALFELEFLAGAALMFGLNPALAQRWAVPVFGGFAVANLLQAVGGACSCGCFGGWAPSPWVVLVFDLFAIALLLACRQPSGTAPAVPGSWRSPGFAAAVLCVGFLGWWQSTYVTMEGTATQKGAALTNAELVLTGDSGRLVLRTDRDGRFRTPLLHEGNYALARSARGRSSDASDPLAVALLWIDVTTCSARGKTVEFSDQP